MHSYGIHLLYQVSFCIDATVRLSFLLTLWEWTSDYIWLHNGTGSVKGYYASIYWKSGDLVRCYRCLAHTQTTEYSATQLVQSFKFKLSHAIIVIEVFDLSPTPTWRSVLLSCGQQLLWLKKRAEKRGRSLLNQIGDWTKSRITGERKSWGGNTCHRVAFWSSWSWSYLPFGGILIILVLVMILIISATMWHSEYWSTRSGSYLPPYLIF